MTLHDRDVVRVEYSTEAGLEARRAAYEYAKGPNAPERVFELIAAARPVRYLEVGCGPGELAARVQRELQAEVVAVDISPRMVELARARGVDASVDDVQDLSFDDESFDCAVAAWMLYHVPDVPRALGELSRVLTPGGQLLAVTNGEEHLKELRGLLELPERKETTFSGENAEELLRARFAAVERHDLQGTVEFPNRDAVVAYVQASMTMFEGRDRVPDFAGSLVVSRRPVVFVATK